MGTPFKLKGMDFGNSPIADNRRRTISVESIEKMIKEGRVTNPSKKLDGGSDYNFKVVGKTKAGKERITILGDEKDISPGVRGTDSETIPGP
tara:strand:+ start:337 stop:612 length:276 start_codon:yes stop_codon:yes gene_type:complete